MTTSTHHLLSPLCLARVSREVAALQKDPHAVRRLAVYLGNPVRAQKWLKTTSQMLADITTVEEAVLLRRLRLLARLNHARAPRTKF